MELQQLRCFVCAAEYGSISRAAKHLMISQPTLSRILKSLEDDIGGIGLFVRTGSGIELTDAGRLMLKEANEMLALEERMKEEMTAYSSSHEDLPVRLVSRCIRRLMYSSIDAFRKKYPSAKFSILQNDDIALHQMQYDLMISSEPKYEMKRNSLKLFTERFMCALPKNGPFSDRDSISVSEYASMPQILFGGHRMVSRTVREKLKSEGINADVVIRCDDSATACHFVNAGCGVFLVPEYTLGPEQLNTVRLLPVDGLDLTRDVCISWPSTGILPTNAKLYRSFLIQFIAGYHI